MARAGRVHPPFDRLRANGLDFCERSHLLLRQPHAERRFVRLTFEVNPAVMFVKNLPANIEAAPFACRFRREERLENARFDLVRNAAAGIRNFNDNA